MTGVKQKVPGRSTRWTALAPASLIVAAVLLGLLQLTTAPPLWWDEGWTLGVARNWVEAGHYGRFLAGEPISPRLAASPVVVRPVAFSFRLFGVGAWQGRLPGLVFTALALWLLYRLTAMLYSRKAGIAVLLLALITPMMPELHPVLVGKQVLAEMPALCLLLAGYLLLFRGLETHRAAEIVGAGLLLSLALVTKLQVIPFLTLSLGVFGIVLLWQRRWHSLLLFALLAATLVAGYRLWPGLLHAGLVTLSPATGSPAAQRPTASLEELLAVTAFVPALSSRLGTLLIVLLAGLPMPVSLVYTARHHLDTSLRGLQRLALWVLAASWFAWYLLMSVGWGRYLFPAAFLSLIFFAGMLGDLTNDFNPEALKSIWQRLRPGRWRGLPRAQQLAALLLLVAATASFTIFVKANVEADDSVFQLAEYLQAWVPPDALIETYESEVVFLAGQTFNFPPDRVHVQLNRQMFLQDHNAKIDYDPLAAGPDYLINGPQAKLWKLYSDDLLEQNFLLAERFGPYDLYRFVGASSPGNGDTPTASPGQ